MPRELLRDRAVVSDDWCYPDEAAGDIGAPLIVEFDEFVKDRAGWLARGSRLGVILKPEHEFEQLIADLPRLSLIAARFTGPGEGRGYTQAKLLRERYGFVGELRAVGYVRPDMVFFLSRCGFNSFEMTDEDRAIAQGTFGTFTAAYQSSNDAGLEHPLPLAHRAS